MDRAEGPHRQPNPFRGPSADAGTIYELGYMTAQNKPACAYTTCTTPTTSESPAAPTPTNREPWLKVSACAIT